MEPVSNVTDPQNIRVETFLDAFDGYGFYESYEDYNYTYTHALEYLPLSEFIPVSVVLGIIGITGFIGNTLVIFAITKVQRMRSITNLFLLSLASADLLLVVVCVPVKVCIFFYFFLFILIRNNQLNNFCKKPPHDKTNKMTYAPSDQSLHCALNE